jgi:hypothetical protein
VNMTGVVRGTAAAASLTFDTCASKMITAPSMHSKQALLEALLEAAAPDESVHYIATSRSKRVSSVFCLRLAAAVQSQKFLRHQPSRPRVSAPKHQVER